MKMRVLRSLICFIIIISMVLCEVAVGFAETENKTTDGTVKDVVYKPHVFAAGDSYEHTGESIQPELTSLTVEVSYERTVDGTVETDVSEMTVTDFGAVPITYRDNIEVGTGYVQVVIEGKTIEIPFNIAARKKPEKSRYESFEVVWNKVAGATGYAVYRSTSPNGKYVRIATVKGADNVSYVDAKRQAESIITG